MKKLIAISLVLGIFCFPMYANATLWEYFNGDFYGSIPDIEYRAGIYAEIASDEYFGTAEQNNRLEAFLRGNDGFNDIGSESMGAVKPFRPSNYETSLSSQLAEEGTETTLVVNSLNLPDGTTLDDAYYGDLLILTVGEGDSEEKIAVGVLNESTLTFTIISRGLEYGRWASSTDNMNQHLPGEIVYVSNDDHYLYQQYTDLVSDQVLSGNLEFTGSTIDFTGDVTIPDYTSSDITLAANIGYVNNTATSGVADASNTVPGKVSGKVR